MRAVLGCLACLAARALSEDARALSRASFEDRRARAGTAAGEARRTRLGACDACLALRVIERYRDELTDMAVEARLVQGMHD